MSTINHAHHHEPHEQKTTSKLNWLRASVLGANDGIVSVAGIVVGVAGANNNPQIILTAGIAGLVAGAISMAAGEYVSERSSRDTEQAWLKKEKYELEHFPEEELEELAHLYEQKGLTPNTARKVAEELTKNDPYAAHIDAELGIDPDDLTSPWQASFASAASFLTGAIIPLIAILAFPQEIRIPMTFVSVLIALAITGTISGKVSNANVYRAIARVVVGGALAMIVTFGVGRLFNVSGL